MLILPALLAACAPSVSSSPSAARLVSPGQEWRMTVGGREAETELVVGSYLIDGRSTGYTYISDEHLVRAQTVSDRFIVRNANDGTPELLTVVRFNLETTGEAPRGCAVFNPVPVAPGESLRGIYMGGVLDTYSLSISIYPSEAARAANVACTLTRVK